MPYAFEEKQYENAANGELWTDPPTLFTPGQVLEKLLGFDLAGTPNDRNPIWSILNQGMPTGIQLSPNLWPVGARPSPDQLPSFAVSLILQYKRSEYVDGRLTGQYRYWRRPYYRYDISRVQHGTLLQLEAAVGPMAMVRYAAPVFHWYTELERHQLNQEVLTRSNFVAPVTIGAAHSIWSFIHAGIGGYANPEGEQLPAESWEQVRNGTMTEIKAISLDVHLAKLASDVIQARLSTQCPIPKSLTIHGKLIDDPHVIESVVNACHFARAVSLTGGSWWIALTQEEGLVGHV